MLKIYNILSQVFKTVVNNIQALLIAIIVFLLGVIKLQSFNNKSKDEKIDELKKQQEINKENTKVKVFNEKAKTKQQEINKRLQNEDDSNVTKRPYSSNL